MPREQRARLLLAFAAVYLIWGSTYLAIRVAIETIPPFMMAGTRFLLAGTVLALWARRRGAQWPGFAQWRRAALIGGLLLLGGNGGVTWAEQYVASSVAALIVGAEPLWVVLLDWLRPGGGRPGRAVWLGLATGFGGIMLLVAPWATVGQPVHSIGALVLVLATISWAIGSLYSSRVSDQPASPLMSTGANMLAGSVLLYAVAALTGEGSRFSAGAITVRSAGALLYLILFGAVVGFTAYLWLLRNTSIAKASTYAYVNPVVAVLLGWLLAGEPITARVLLAAVIIILGVTMISVLPQLLRAARGPVAAAEPAPTAIRPRPEP